MEEGHVYVLALEGNNFYVGWSAQVEGRIASHFLGAGARWTMKHKSVSVVSVQPGSKVLESCVTISLMCKHGWEHVRGGNWTCVDMQKAPACLTKAQHFAKIREGTECVEQK